MEVLKLQYIRLEVKATDFSLQKRKFLSFRFVGGYNIGFLFTFSGLDVLILVLVPSRHSKFS